MIEAASSQCSDHSARPWRPAPVGTNMSRRNRFMLAGSPRDRRAKLRASRRELNQCCHAAKFQLAGFRAAQGGDRLAPKRRGAPTRESEETMAQAQLKERPARDWPFEVRPLHPSLGVEITGITLADAVAPKLFD